MEACAHVVLGHGPGELGQERSGHHFRAVHLVACQGAAFLAEHSLPAGCAVAGCGRIAERACEYKGAALLLEGKDAAFGLGRAGHERTAVLADDDLVIGHLGAGGKYPVLRLEQVGHVKEYLRGIFREFRELQPDSGRLLGAYLQVLHAPRCERLPVGDKGPHEPVLVKALEKMLVVNLDLAGNRVGRGGQDVPHLVAGLICVRMELPVRRNHSVAVERPVGRIIFIEVASVGYNVVRSRIIDTPADALVCKVPDEAALEARILADQVPILLEIPHGVAHRVCIFALYQWLGRPSGDHPLAFPGCSIHGTVDVGVGSSLSPLVLDRPGRVEGLDPIVAGCEVLPVTCFVAHAPYDHGRMVYVAHHHPLVTDQMGGLEIGTVGEGLLPIAHPMGFDVGLVDHIEPVLVTEGKPERVIRVVACTHGVDVQFLHDADIPEHLGLRNHVSSFRTDLVPVRPLYEDRLAVDKQLAVPYLDSPEPERYGSPFYQGVSVERTDLHRVKIGHLGAPRLGTFHLADERDLVLGELGDIVKSGSGHDPAFPVQHPYLDHLDAGGHLDVGGETAVHAGRQPYVDDLVLRPGIDVNAPGDSAETPEVLVLKVAAVTPTEDFQGDGVLPCPDKLGDVEPRLQLAVFAVTCRFAVDPHPDVGSRGTYAQADLGADPGLVDVERPAVLADMVLLCRRIRRIVPVMSAPRITDVEVQRVAVAVEFPHPGDRHASPGGIVIGRGLEACRPSFDRLVEVELPQAIERQGLLLFRNECGMHGHPVLFEHVGILPRFHLLL